MNSSTRTFPFRSALRMLTGVTFLIVAFLVAGCGEGGPDERTGEGKTVLTFWHFNSEPAQKEALMGRIRAFEQENADVHIELSELSWNDGQTKLQLAFNSKTAPDVLELGSDWIAKFSSEGVLADQSKMAGDSIGRFMQQIAAPGRWKDGIYAWPWVVDTRVLFRNTGLLASAGVDTSHIEATWEEVLVNAEKVRAKGQEFYGFAANGPDRHRLYKKIIPFFWSNNGIVMDETGKPAINSPQNVAALQTYLELMRTGVMDSQKGLDQLFMQGKVAYWISGPWLVAMIAKDNPSLKYATAMLPRFPGGSSVSFGGGEYLAINNASTKKDLAKKFVTFMTSPSHALEFAKALPGGTTPADLSVAQDPFLQSASRKTFTEQMKSAWMTPVHPKWLDIEEVIEEEVSFAMLGEKEPQKALDDAQARITALITSGSASAHEADSEQ